MLHGAFWNTCGSPCLDYGSAAWGGWKPGDGMAVCACVRVCTRERVCVQGSLTLRSGGTWECVLGPPGGKESARFSRLFAVLQLLCFICLKFTSALKRKTTLHGDKCSGNQSSWLRRVPAWIRGWTPAAGRWHCLCQGQVVPPGPVGHLSWSSPPTQSTTALASLLRVSVCPAA